MCKEKLISKLGWALASFPRIHQILIKDSPYKKGEGVWDTKVLRNGPMVHEHDCDGFDNNNNLLLLLMSHYTIYQWDVAP